MVVSGEQQRSQRRISAKLSWTHLKLNSLFPPNCSWSTVYLQVVQFPPVSDICSPVIIWLEKGMATHSSILAWRIPWTDEPDGLQSTGSQRVGHDWVTNTGADLCEQGSSIGQNMVMSKRPAWYYPRCPVGASQVVLVVKNPPGNAGDERDMG